MERMSAEAFRALQAQPGQRRKHHNQPMEYNGRRYDSKKEARYAVMLDLARQAGEVLYWIPQPSIPLHHASGVRYRPDFFVKYRDGHEEWVDVKGYDTPQSRQKRRQVKEAYGIEVKIV
ncbi:MAG: DUF1064 domain-containing protein [bacterium]|jgi:hypothetical protein|nr:DUF1064 domain-containing protein [bacterium]